MSSIESPHDRAFGVEIECGFPKGVYAAEELMVSTFGERWSVGCDGTDVEVRTPILQGEEGFSKLKRAMEVIRDAGGYVTPSDGMHVHHDAPDFAANPALCLPLVQSWRENIESIQAMVAPLRRHSYGACPEWSDRAFAVLEQWTRGESDYLRVGRNDLNVAALGKSRPSIEIRLHEGTLDGDVAVAWVQFGQKFLFEASKRKIKMRKKESDELLLSSIKLSPEATAILLAKKEHHYATPLAMFESRRKPREVYVAAGNDDYDNYDDDYDDYCGCDDCRDY